MKICFTKNISGFMTLPLPCILVSVGYRVAHGVVAKRLDFFKVKKCDLLSLREREAVVCSTQVAQHILGG